MKKMSPAPGITHNVSYLFGSFRDVGKKKRARGRNEGGSTRFQPIVLDRDPSSEKKVPGTRYQVSGRLPSWVPPGCLLLLKSPVKNPQPKSR